uniref:Uncharacterized protein n=1 Tax=Panagrolaimus sp. ES5 TaxID=591445 RepID=A0AC34G185_9BILA
MKLANAAITEPHFNLITELERKNMDEAENLMGKSGAEAFAEICSNMTEAELMAELKAINKNRVIDETNSAENPNSYTAEFLKDAVAAVAEAEC